MCVTLNRNNPTDALDCVMNCLKENLKRQRINEYDTYWDFENYFNYLALLQNDIKVQN